MKLSELNEHQLTDEIMSRLLFGSIADDGLPGDCIIVFGSRIATRRAENGWRRRQGS